MANNTIDLKYLVNYDQLKAANAEILKTGSNAKKSASVFEQSFRRVEAENKKALSSVRQKIAFSKRMEAQKAKEARVTQQAADQEAKTLERLRQKYDQGHVAMEIYSQELNDLAMARKRNVITVEEQKAAIERLNVATKNGTVVSAEYGGAAGQMGRRMSRSGVMVQQAGYQIGDFIVQAQSGQNIMVAFGQQATQMAGTLTMLGGKFIGIGTVLGIVIPLATALGAALMRVGGEAEKTENAVSDIVSALDSYRNSVKLSKASTRDLTAEFGEASTQIRGMQTLLQNVAVSQALDNLSKGTSVFGEDLDAAVNKIKNLQQSLNDVKVPTEEEISLFGADPMIAEEAIAGYREEIENTAAALNLSAEQAISLQGALGEVGKSTGMEGIRDSANAALELISELGFETENVPAPIREAVLHLENLATAAAEATAPVESLADSTLAAQKQQLAMATQILSSGKDSEAVAELRARQEAINLGLVDDQLNAYIETALLIHNIAAETAEKVAKEQEFKKAAEDAAAEIQKALDAGKALSSLNLSVGVEAAAAAAAVLATNLGISLGAAQRMVGLAAGQGVSGPDGAVQSVRESQTIPEEDIVFHKVYPARTKPSSSSGGGGGSKSDAEVMQENLTKLQEQLAVERELIGASEARVKIVRALGLEFVQNNPQVVEGLQEQINKNLELVQVEKDRQSVLDTIESSMSKGFMSMVEGTKSVKDAFRDMAKDIIKQLYDVYVIQKMVGAVGEGGAAGTGIMGILQGLKIFDGGGYTGSGPRSGGMDGRGGYLAMLHPRETVVDHTKSGSAGGGDGAVYVTNNFTMAANGDDSVKRIIAQSMPAIVNASKQGVMDARRRGGSMKNTFG